MARPRSIRDDGTLVWWDGRRSQVEDYCKQDVRTEQAIAKVLHRLIRASEPYLLNERINDRVAPIDKELLAAQEIAAEGARRASLAIREITEGAVVGVTNTGQLREWLGTQGIANGSVAKGVVTELLNGDLPPKVRSVLEARAEAGRSSVAKIKAALMVISDDNRARGLSLYHGAGTGRFTARLFQPHNLPRGEIEQVEDFIPYVLGGKYDVINLMENPVAVISACCALSSVPLL
jgi:DNA polymerase